MSAPLHADVAGAIGQQVEQMILQAQKDSEARVKHDLSAARQQLQQMEAAIGELSDRVGRVVRNSGAGAMEHSQTVDRTFMNTKLAQLEAKWGSEVKALKQDLHRTILAHNHNSDLMRHHRDALDEARKKLGAQTQPTVEQVDAQIAKVDRMLRAGQAKQRASDALTERLTALEQQVVEMLPSAPMPGSYPGMMPPGMAGMPGMPPGMEREVAAAKRAAKKDEPPTEEEVRQRFAQATKGARAAAGASETTFDAEAPIFLPSSLGATGGAASAAGAAPMKLGAPAGLELPSSGGADSDEAEEPAAEAEEGAEADLAEEEATKDADDADS